MSACLLLGAQQIFVAAAGFTLAWTHSVEKTSWEEDWRVVPAGFELQEARIEGTGAGMEPPESATFDGHVWRYRPAPPLIQDRLILARSGATGGAWEICDGGQCWDIPETGAADEGPVVLSACP